MKHLRVRWVLLLAFCTSFQRGESRNGGVRRGWGQIRFWLPFAVCCGPLQVGHECLKVHPG